MSSLNVESYVFLIYFMFVFFFVSKKNTKKKHGKEIITAGVSVSFSVAVLASICGC